jgi:hypothetical protein
MLLEVRHHEAGISRHAISGAAGVLAGEAGVPASEAKIHLGSVALGWSEC